MGESGSGWLAWVSEIIQIIPGKISLSGSGRRLQLFGGGNQMALVAFFYRPSASASALHAILQLTVDNSQAPVASIQNPEPRTQNPVPMSRGPWAPFVVAAGNRLDIPSIISAYHSPTSIDIWLMAKMSPKCRPRRRRANKQVFGKGRGPTWRGLLLISKNGKRNGNHNFATLTHHNFQSAYNSALPGKQSIIS